MNAMKALVARTVVVLAIVTSFTVTAEAQPVTPQGISVTSTVSAVGVLAQR